jgi:metallophosphoesterase (TIGR00282 family)
LINILLAGDVVGEAGLLAAEALLPALKLEFAPCFAVVNGENAAAGFGLDEEGMKRLFVCGTDVITSGNHIWEKRDFIPIMEASPNVLRPANYPPGAPGRGLLLCECVGSSSAGIPLAVINLQGREFMTAVDCPFRTFDSIYAELTQPPPTALSSPPAIIVDFHAESTREKEALAFYLSGRAAVVVGTHTHVQTSDERLLPGGKTAYITDLGMTGSIDSIIGMDTRIALSRARTQVSYRMECAQGRPGMQGVVVALDEESRLPLSIRRFCREAPPEAPQ